MDAYAVAVVVDGVGVLQAVKNGLESIVKVIGIALIIGSKMKDEWPGNMSVTVQLALLGERCFIGAEGIVLYDAAFSVLSWYCLIVVCLADGLAVDCFVLEIFIWFH